MSISQDEIDALLSSAGDLATEINESSDSVEDAAPEQPSAAPIHVPEELRKILKLPVPLRVTLAERKSTMESVLDMNLGSIIEFDVPNDSDLTLSIANKPIARGHAVKIGENFGLRITEIGELRERLSAMRKK